MLTRRSHKGLTWIDLENPTKHEVAGLVDEFELDALVAEELLLPSSRPRAEFSSTHAYAIFHFPTMRRSSRIREQEIDFVIGRDHIITTRYDSLDPIHDLTKIFEVESILDRSGLSEHPGTLFFFMMKRLYKSVENEIEHIRRDLQTIEEHIFAEREVEMVATLSRSARDLLNLRQTIEPHREVLKSIESEGPAFFGAELAPYLRALSGEYYRVHNHIMRHTEFLHELRETNNSLLSTKQNETMKVLTVLAVLTFPPALLVATMALDVPGNPIDSVQGGFWIVVGAILAATAAMLAFFKFKKWM